MTDKDIGQYITLTKMNNGETLKIHQKFVSIREGKDKIMAISYKAPIFEIIKLERFFENIKFSQKIKFNIGETGNIETNFRGLIEGKEKNYSKNIDHKIILLEEYKCPRKDIRRFSSKRFVSKVKKNIMINI